MHKLLLSAAMLAAIGVSPAHATLQIEIFDNGTLIDNVTGITTGAASLTTNDANFANITINAQGSPILPNADLSSVTLDATASAGFTGSHELTFDVIQSAVAGTGNTQSTFTVNGLVNDPGPTTERTFANGVLLAPADAKRAGIDPDDLKFSAPGETANGVGYMAPVTLPTSIGQNNDESDAAMDSPLQDSRSESEPRS